MNDESKEKGRPRCEIVHGAILDAVYEILQTKTLRDLTIEEVAKRANVGKPSIYRRWPTKSAMVMDMFLEKLANDTQFPNFTSAEASLRHQLFCLVEQLNKFLGKIASEIIGEGQCDPEILQEYRDRFMNKRRENIYQLLEKGIINGEFKPDLDISTTIDLLYGPICFRMLVKHAPIDKAFVHSLINMVFPLIKK